ncbi:MAG: amidase family protein [Acidimicrobiia bacterium]
MSMPTAARDIGAAVRAGEVSAVDVVSAALGRIERDDAGIGAFLRTYAETALERAHAVDAAVAAGRDPGPLAGVPVGLKDVLATTGIETTCGSRILEGWHPPYDATVVRRLREAGAVDVGKTNCDEFAMGSSNENSAYRPVANPHDRSRAGRVVRRQRAAAVAAGFVPVALGPTRGARSVSPRRCPARSA